MSIENLADISESITIYRRSVGLVDPEGVPEDGLRGREGCIVGMYVVLYRPDNICVAFR
jgi:hypothetical protein